MPKPNYIPFFIDDQEALEPLDDAECGRLFKALLEYGRTGEPQEISGNERFLYPIFRNRIERFAQNYEATCKKNAENARKRTQATVSDGKLAHTMASDGQRNEPSETETETETKTETSTPQPPKGFDLFWSAYPRKVGKEAARKAFSRVKAPVETLLSAIERQKCGEQWTRESGRYIPNPSTWLNQGRWEDEETPAQQVKKPASRPPISPAPGGFSQDSADEIRRSFLENKRLVEGLRGEP